MRDAKEWNVISGGPSRKYVTQYDLIQNCPVVTVNRSIDVIDRGIVVDFAMFCDPPNRVVPDLDVAKYLIPPIQVWCPQPVVMPQNGVMQLFDMVSLWEPYLPASVGIRTTPFGLVDGDDGVKRHQFSLLGALERVLMFRPERVRLISADMMGSWAPGMTETECEEHQSLLSQAQRELSRAQKAVNESRGKDVRATTMRDHSAAMVNEIKKRGDPGIFKRWAYERVQLKKLEQRANGVGCVFEYHTPEVVTA
jgi:hypothetical protein